MKKAWITCDVLGKFAGLFFLAGIRGFVPENERIGCDWEFITPFILGLYTRVVLRCLGWGVMVKSAKRRRSQFLTFLSLPFVVVSVFLRPVAYVFRFGLNIKVGDLVIGVVGGFCVDSFLIEGCCLKTFIIMLRFMAVMVYEVFVVCIQVSILVMLGGLYLQGTPSK